MSPSAAQTMVTVVDALNFFDNFATADFLSDRQENGEVDEQDERNISDLLTDQIEFANVLILNKTDLVSAAQLERIVSLLQALNPSADILTSVKSQIDLTKILNTRRFSFEDAVLSAGWLKSLREEVKPFVLFPLIPALRRMLTALCPIASRLRRSETEEYGIGSFVYRARRPFHPLRLWEVIRTRLVVIQDSYDPNGPGEDGMDVDSDEESDAESNASWEDEPDLEAYAPRLLVAMLTSLADNLPPLTQSAATRPSRSSRGQEGGSGLLAPPAKQRLLLACNSTPHVRRVVAGRRDAHHRWRLALDLRDGPIDVAGAPPVRLSLQPSLSPLEPSPNSHRF